MRRRRGTRARAPTSCRRESKSADVVPGKRRRGRVPDLTDPMFGKERSAHVFDLAKHIVPQGAGRSRSLLSGQMAGPRMAYGASSGMIALRNSAEKTVGFSKSLTETAPRVLSLQRDFLRSVPWIKRAYGIRMDESARASPLATRSSHNHDIPLAALRIAHAASLPAARSFSFWRCAPRRRCARC